MKKFFGEFKKFITRGNIVDMSVGVIVGGAFTAIVNALSNNILKPVINWFLALILGQNSLAGIYTYLKKVVSENGEVDLTQSIYIDWGAFINAIINFLIVAFILFTIVKMINKLAESKNKAFDQKARIEFKKEKGLKLSKKEIKFLEEQEAKEKKALEEKKKLEEEEALRKEEEEKKLTKSEALLVEIRDLLAKK
ncbi:MAG: large conductance mechanosensitive channel protein MscL [Bacilli bacterium]|nr:large conductance mechanosensitive channel protein MscL [Bacillales bacterium]MDY2575616.1 large conductance mechanosensitive channel protein MscL [Bacilli bacterium]